MDKTCYHVKTKLGIKDMKIKTLVIAAAMLIVSSLANAEIFYGQSVGNWIVTGDTGGNIGSPACWIEYHWQDGSVLQLGEDLNTGQLDIWFQNNEWEIIDPIPGLYTLRVNIIGSRGTIVGGNMTYELVTKNTIVISDVEKNSFWDAFARLAEMRFIMPGTIQNAHVSLANSQAALNLLSQCKRQFLTISQDQNSSVFSVKHGSI